MSSIQSLFYQAQLAEAAYADFLKFGPDVKAALQDKSNNMSFSDSQASDFVSHWRVVDQLPDTTPDGFSATLFQNTTTHAC